MQEDGTQDGAAENTANVLIESCLGRVDKSIAPFLYFTAFIDHFFQVSEEQKELPAAGLDSSVLSPFTESISEFNEHDSEFVPQMTTSTLAVLSLQNISNKITGVASPSNSCPLMAKNPNYQICRTNTYSGLSTSQSVLKLLMESSYTVMNSWMIQITIAM